MGFRVVEIFYVQLKKSIVPSHHRSSREMNSRKVNFGTSGVCVGDVRRPSHISQLVQNNRSGPFPRVGKWV